MLIGAPAASLLELLKLHQESILFFLNNTTEATEEKKKERKRRKEGRKREKIKREKEGGKEERGKKIKIKAIVAKRKEIQHSFRGFINSFNFVKTANSNVLTHSVLAH